MSSFPEITFRAGTRSVEKILRGEKLVTRRPYTDTNFYYFKRLVGRIVRVSEGDEKAHVVIVDVYKQRLGEIDDREAQLEGFSSKQEFVEVWKSIYGVWRDDDLVVVIEFVPYGCANFDRSRKKIVIEGVEAPLCRGIVARGVPRGSCAFCWLSSFEWCGTCAKLEVRGSRRICRALGEVEIPRLSPKMAMRRRCEFYERRIPAIVKNGFAKLASKGVKEVH